MITSKLLSRIKALVTSAAITVTALAVPVVMPQKEAEAAGYDNYAKLLQHSLYFYDANMCGKVGSKSAIDWRGDCHTDDEVQGGFHDAGDHAMFGLPQGYTASTLLWSYYEFKDAFDATGQTDHLKLITDHFCDFFKRSTKLNGDSVSALLYQKGDGNEDHSYWGPPEKQGGGRKMFWATSGASDIAAEYAASLAANYVCFGDQESLKYAEALYKFSTQHNQVVTDGPYGFYNNGSCQDEQAWAAGWLYLATKKENYKNDCGSKYNSYLGWVHGWESVDLGAACLYAEITNDWSKVNSYMQGKFSGNGYFCLDDWGSARLNCSAQMTALIATKKGNANMAGWCKGQMDYILGNNPFNVCMVTGLESNSAKNTHHRAASGYEGYNPPDGMNEGTTTYHPTKGHVLIGALAGGPTTGGQYSDVMNDYKCNEVALDYNAGLVGAAAGLYSIYKTGSTSTSIPGVTKIYSGSSQPVVTTQPTTQPTTATTKQTTQSSNNNNNNTTASTNNNNNTTTTTTNGGNSSGGNGTHEIKPGKQIVYGELPKDDKMIGWDWADFGISSSEKVKKVEINISASQSIGKWQGAFGTSTQKSPDYWAQSADMEQSISGNSGTITWDVPSDVSEIIQYNYGGQLKWGIWWIDCGTFTVDSIKVYTTGGGSNNNPNPVTTATTKQTTQSTSNNNNNTTTTTTKGGNSSGGNGSYEIKPGKQIVYGELPKDDKMIGWDWADFNIPSSEKVKKVEINISASQSIGKWQGAFGTSTQKSPDYWAQSADMEQSISGNSGTITWDVPSDISEIIQYNYGGQLKWGIWWIDCGTFTVDSIKVYTTGGSSSGQTTSKSTTATTKSTTTTTKGGNSSGGNGSYEIKPSQQIVYGELPKDDKMIGWDWADFNIPSSEKVKKVEINISASQSIGKWQGAFGTSTQKSPDYWAQSADMEQSISGNSGTITWDVPSDISEIIQYNYGGQLKWGIWWIDCGTFTVDSVKVYTTGGSSSVQTTTKSTTATTKSTTTTVKTTTTTKDTTKSTTKATGTAIPAGTKYGDVNCDGKINIADVVALNMYILNSDKNKLSSAGYANADCKRDNVINMSDSSILVNYVAELINESDLGK